MMRRPLAAPVLCAAVLLCSCNAGPGRESAAKLTVAAAANLTNVFQEIGGAFTAGTSIEVIFSYGSTAQLAQQIEHGAPFDLFAAADSEHVDSLVSAGKLSGRSRAVYARGQLALWIPNGKESGVHELMDLTAQPVRFIALPQPDLAPYGRASVEVLKQAGLWEAVKPKLVYGTSVTHARQLARSGNADAAFTAYSLLLNDKGVVLKIDPSLHHPIEQALGIVTSSGRTGQANRFRSFLLGPEGRAILARSGYLLP